MRLQNKALELGLTGWVRNRRDGRVEVTAEGYEEDLQELLRWLHTGAQDTLQRSQWKALAEVHAKTVLCVIGGQVPDVPALNETAEQLLYWYCVLTACRVSHVRCIWC